MRGLITLAAALAALATPVAARAADDATHLNVLGTADVSDSGLSKNVLIPDFQAANPGVTMTYTAPPGGSGTAIAQAQIGAGSALIVHAPSLENQFVAGGYSLEPVGRSLFWGDYIFAGPAGANGDPAGAATSGAHDIVNAFQKVAIAGAANNADFVSRGNTAGTAVQERQLWPLTSGVPLCPVAAAQGGGAAPTDTAGHCPSTDPTSIDWTYPSWYHKTGLGQAPNLSAANTCNFPNATNAGHTTCYVFVDRGTFKCLNTDSCRGANGAPANLTTITRNNDPGAPGGRNALINIFHVYAINPAKFDAGTAGGINTALATKFLDFITSPTEQARIGQYLDASDAPFIPAAAPSLTASVPPAVTAGTPVTVTGKLANVIPGLPVLNGETVTVSDVSGGPATAVPVTSGRTGNDGTYSLSFSPTHSGAYAVTSGSITKLEFPDPAPAFSDLLQPTSSTATQVTVTGAFSGFDATSFPGGVVMSGGVLPRGAHSTRAAVTLQARRAGSTGDYATLATQPLGADSGTFAVSAPLAAGTWDVRATFADPGQLEPATSGVRPVTVPAASASPSPTPTATTPVPTRISISSAKVKKGKLTLKAKLKPAAVGAGSIKLLGVATNVLKGRKKVKGGTLKTLSTHAVKGGATSVTFRKKLTRNRRWQLQLKYLPAGNAPVAFGAIRSLKVK